MNPVEQKHIESTPGVVEGRPRVTGTRIRVQDIYVWYELQGQSPDEIVARFPELALSDVHAALAYYWDNRDLIRRQMQEEDDVVEKLRQEAGPGLLARKLNPDNDRDSLPS